MTRFVGEYDHIVSREIVPGSTCIGRDILSAVETAATELDVWNPVSGLEDGPHYDVRITNRDEGGVEDPHTTRIIMYEPAPPSSLRKQLTGRLGYTNRMAELYIHHDWIYSDYRGIELTFHGVQEDSANLVDQYADELKDHFAEFIR